MDGPDALVAALPTGRTPAPRAAVEEHNRLLALGSRRVDDLEARFARVLEPILRQAGDEAATAFRRLATDHLTACALVASAPGVTAASAMVCLKPRPEEASALAIEDGAPPDELHVTLAYLGEVEGDLTGAVEALRPVAASLAPLAGVVGGAGVLAPAPDSDVMPAILLPDVPGLVETRVAVTEALATAGIEYGRGHGFAAHLTVAYVDGDGAIADPSGQDGADPADTFLQPIHFDALLVVQGDRVVAELPLVGAPALTAAGKPPPGWSAPAGDELVNVAAVVAKLKTKTDPVRRATVEAQMTPTLKAAGVRFDVTNPLIAGALASSGTHIRSIAETTRLNVTRIVGASYDQGLSIPDTAKAITAGMDAASRTRATMIARTELAGAVHAGSLAATRIVSEVTGDAYTKQWLTAPGAPHPRHEDYEGLDGQARPLEEPFDVGGAPLMFPGDPDGDPGETINCRCTLVYDSPAGEQGADAEDAPDLEA